MFSFVLHLTLFITHAFFRSRVYVDVRIVMRFGGSPRYHRVFDANCCTLDCYCRRICKYLLDVRGFTNSNSTCCFTTLMLLIVFTMFCRMFRILFPNYNININITPMCMDNIFRFSHMVLVHGRWVPMGRPEPIGSEPSVSDSESFGSTRKVQVGSVSATTPVGARKHKRLRPVGRAILIFNTSRFKLNLLLPLFCVIQPEPTVINDLIDPI